ncbi:hypothetical protein PanWU01x14_086680 [Parasponia andersonii]|uniref:Uncharacterized protein n=1 Tax=Parasponia andersonii TaxID=3476 RepID=A0A2P5D8E0_PARAD|nr:hypothetical protein PanWU01x14_086680 [Parasponia andersonii]
MGFRDLLAFNQALLAKEAWNLVNNPQTLASRILQNKYFRGRDFIQAQKNGNSSSIWQSISWGHETLSLGLRWKVKVGFGSGRMVNVFKDLWLPQPSFFKSITATNPLVISLSVADLMLEPGL